MSLQLLKDQRTSELVVVDTSADDEEGLVGIRCPRCSWRPLPWSRWYCESGVDSPEPGVVGCGTAWNTFSTAGRCPGCGHQWRWTSCLRCGEWSLHIDWYEHEGGQRR